MSKSLRRARRAAPLVYVDTNVFDNLVKRSNGVVAEDEATLRRHVSSGQLIVLASHVTIREIIAALERRPDVARAQIRLLAAVADWDRFVKFSTDILEDDINHFAFNGEGANTVFEGDRQADRIRKVLRGVVAGRTGLKEFQAAINEDREFKERFVKGVRAAREQTREGIQEFRRAGKIPGFDQWFEMAWEDYLRAFLRTFKASHACERRGLQKLFRLPSVRAMVGMSTSTVYRTAVEEKTLRGSASRDLQHAVCAAAARADILVTHDREFAIILARASIKGLQVLRLRELLDSVA